MEDGNGETCSSPGARQDSRHSAALQESPCWDEDTIVVQEHLEPPSSITSERLTIDDRRPESSKTASALSKPAPTPHILPPDVAKLQRLGDARPATVEDEPPTKQARISQSSRDIQHNGDRRSTHHAIPEPDDVFIAQATKLLESDYVQVLPPVFSPDHTSQCPTLRSDVATTLIAPVYCAYQWVALVLRSGQHNVHCIAFKRSPDLETGVKKVVSGILRRTPFTLPQSWGLEIHEPCVADIDAVVSVVVRLLGALLPPEAAKIYLDPINAKFWRVILDAAHGVVPTSLASDIEANLCIAAGTTSIQRCYEARITLHHARTIFQAVNTRLTVAADSRLKLLNYTDSDLEHERCKLRDSGHRTTLSQTRVWEFLEQTTEGDSLRRLNHLQTKRDLIEQNLVDSQEIRTAVARLVELLDTMHWKAEEGANSLTKSALDSVGRYQEQLAHTLDVSDRYKAILQRLEDSPSYQDLQLLHEAKRKVDVATQTLTTLGRSL